ncbi:MAG: hypothetical protein HON47_04405 [Candidatus Diapherotrites archaeon]|jgi:uncharacterized protein (UPF0333 family)|uniref:Class III signal peptide-containing protein n=1 Tax=Candidatus Iainarchaeum sp. TaxID=3101447 RepID=A0A8T5GFN0_9ARCH|nr:hypothetical protein [Candidatus Diapherotrites archaeon]MBT7240891.1 hypothetical protein [Candidatus Diapherotrites archaeon]
MKSRGQVAIEFIFIVLLVVVYLFSVTKPLVESSQGIIEDIDTITRSNNEAKKLLNSVKRVSMQGSGSKETIQLFIPLNGTVGCYHDGNIGFNAKINQRTLDGSSINPRVSLCENNICDKNLSKPNVTIDCLYDVPTNGTIKLAIIKTDVGVTIGPS